MATGPVVVAVVGARLGGAPSATDQDLQDSLDTATAHIVPLLDVEYQDPIAWPADLHDGIVIAAVLTYRNAESPTPSAAVASGAPVVPPIAWDRWTRHRLGQYTAAGSWAQ